MNTENIMEISTEISAEIATEGFVQIDENVTLLGASNVFEILVNPVSRIIQVGETAKFSVKVQGDGLLYQWQFSKDDGQTWVDSTLAGSKTASISVGGTIPRNGQMYRCVVTNSNGDTVTSSAALLVVRESAEEVTDVELVVEVLSTNMQIVGKVYNDVHLIMVLALLTFVASCFRGWRKNVIKGAK